MTRDELEALFKKHKNDPSLRFEQIPPERRKSTRPDLHAFILLNELSPGESDIINSAEHDQFWVEVDSGDLAKAATEDQIIDLIRCGLLYDSSYQAFYFFA